MAPASQEHVGPPRLSVVVPTFQRAERLERLLRALAAQDLDGGLQVIVVDDGSSDGTADEAVRLGGLLGLDLDVVRMPTNGGPSAARNTGWRRSGAPLVAFTDDDCAPDPGWATALVAAAARAGVVQGRTEPDPAHERRRGPFSRTLEVRDEGLYPTCNVAYARTVLEALDGFDPAFRRSCDDTDLAWRARESGVPTTYAPDALVFHEITASSLRGLLRSLPRWDDVALAVKRHPELRRRYLVQRLFWKRSHPAALGVVAGLVAAAVAGSALPLVLGIPYVHHRVRREPLPTAGPRRRWVLLPAALLVDLCEVAVMVKGSVRHRSPVL